MAGVVDYWRDPDTEVWIPTYTIITTTATDDAGLVHDRMPMVVTPRSLIAEALDEYTAGRPDGLPSRPPRR